MKRYTFKARIEPGVGGGAGVVFPYSVEREFGVKGRVAVKSTIDGVHYTGSLMKCGPESHMLGVLKSIRGKIGKGPGDIVDVVVWKDEEVRKAEVPVAFEESIKTEGVLPSFEKLCYTCRKEYCRWITEAKKEETRQARIAKAVQMLKDGMKTPG
jgi:hypothetical protein